MNTQVGEVDGDNEGTFVGGIETVGTCVGCFVDNGGAFVDGLDVVVIRVTVGRDDGTSERELTIKFPLKVTHL